MTPPADVAPLLAAVPLGTSRGCAQGRAYMVTRSQFSGGRSMKLVANELGGRDYISLNFYDLTNGPQLYPCEMPPDKVITFLRALRIEPV